MSVRPRGFFAIGVESPKTSENIGGLWRSAHAFGASFVFTIGRRYRRQPTDTSNATAHVPLYSFDTIDDCCQHMPEGSVLVGIERDDHAVRLQRFFHPEQCIYILGAEDTGLSEDMRTRCRYLVELPSLICLNVAIAGSIVLYDRCDRRHVELEVH